MIGQVDAPATVFASKGPPQGQSAPAPLLISLPSSSLLLFLAQTPRIRQRVMGCVFSLVRGSTKRPRGPPRRMRAQDGWMAGGNGFRQGSQALNSPTRKTFLAAGSHSLKLHFFSASCLQQSTPEHATEHCSRLSRLSETGDRWRVEERSTGPACVSPRPAPSPFLAPHRSFQFLPFGPLDSDSAAVPRPRKPPHAPRSKQLT